MGPIGFLLWIAAAVVFLVVSTLYCTCVTCRGFGCIKYVTYSVVIVVAAIAVIRFLQLNIDYFAGSDLYTDANVEL